MPLIRFYNKSEVFSNGCGLCGSGYISRIVLVHFTDVLNARRIEKDTTARDAVLAVGHNKRRAPARGQGMISVAASHK
jgi:hypothetical protein